jgi:hypothetical protein
MLYFFINKAGYILAFGVAKGTNVAPEDIAVNMSHRLKSNPILEYCAHLSFSFTL